MIKPGGKKGLIHIHQASEGSETALFGLASELAIYGGVSVLITNEHLIQ